MWGKGRSTPVMARWDQSLPWRDASGRQRWGFSGLRAESRVEKFSFFFFSRRFALEARRQKTDSSWQDVQLSCCLLISFAILQRVLFQRTAPGVSKPFDAI